MHVVQDATRPSDILATPHVLMRKGEGEIVAATDE